MKVCYLEDSYGITREVKGILVDAGYQLDHFYEPRDALQALFDGDYDIFLSSQFHSKDSLSCCDILRTLRMAADPDKRLVKRVVMTTDDSPRNRQSLTLAGANSILVNKEGSNLKKQLLQVLSDLQSETRDLREGWTEALSEVSSAAAGELTAIPSVLPGSARISKRGDVERVGSTAEQTAAVPGLTTTTKASNVTRDGASAAIDWSAVRSERSCSATPSQPGKAESSLNLVKQPSAVPALSASPSPAINSRSAESVYDGNTKAETALGAAAPPAQARREFPPASPARERVDSPVARAEESSANTGVPHYVLAVVPVLAFIGISAAWLYFSERTPVEVVTVQKGTLVTAINGRGLVVSKKQVDISPSVAGHIQDVHATDGQAVKKGTTLAQLDSREVAVKIKRGEAQQMVAAEELLHAERVVQQLQDAMAKARTGVQGDNAEQAGTTPENGGQSKSDGADAPADIEVLAEKLRAAEAAVIEAKSKQVTAKEDLRALRLERDRLRLTAPFDGVVARSFAIEGQWVEPGAPLFTFVDMSQLQVAVTIDGEDASDIAVGQKVKMHSPAFPALDWTESIVQTGPSSASRRDGSSGHDVVYYASLGENAPPLHYGAVIDAHVITESRPNTLKLPFESIVRTGGLTTVGVVEDGRVRFRPVKLGIRALTDVEILHGLSPGQWVLLPRRSIEEGQRVEPTVLPEYAFAATEGFPLREKYGDVAIYTTDQLRVNHSSALIVDVRSNFEYNVVHIGNAINVPVSEADFVEALSALRTKDAIQPIVFYCNGHTCSKSYKAARLAAQAGFRHVYAYDSGIFDWMRANRDKTVLLGRSPAPLEKMVSEEYFQSRLIGYDSFVKKATAQDALVVDVRDEMQKQRTLDLPSQALPLDEFITLLRAGRFEGKQLLIFDAVGKQVRWLQYVLEDNGFKDYFFLKKGVAGS